MEKRYIFKTEYYLIKKKPLTLYNPTYKMYQIANSYSKLTGGWLWREADCVCVCENYENIEVMAYGYKVSFWVDENVIKLIVVMGAQLFWV